MLRDWMRFGLAALALGASPAVAQEPFYKGKTINIMVGFGPGGGYDLYARLLARVLGNHIPGVPNVVVQNHVFTAAPKDGLTVAGVNQGAAMFQMLGGKGAQYDPAKFAWLGSMAYSNNTVYTWRASGITSINDAKKREVSVAGSGVISDANIYPAILNALVGTKFKIINGYAGTNESNLALERGEVEGRGGGAYSSLVSTKPEWLREKTISILAQIGFEKEPGLPDTPLLLDLVTTEEARQIATVVTLPTAIGYNHWVAPEVPADRLEMLRKAYAASLKDPELLADAKKQMLEIRPKTAAELDALVKKAAAVPQPVLDQTAKILEW